MSLLEELESRGVTAEDLEKAASVRLFEKAAAAEGVDLDSLDVDQVEDLYAAFLSNQSDSDDTTKEASAMNDEIVDLFEKTAAAEGIDLDDMADDELAELYNHYVENVLPLQVEEYEKEASADDEEIVLDMFQKTAAAEGLDLNEFNQYELAEMYEHYVDNVLPLQMGDKTAAAEVEDAHMKLAEAEILGRHMARSYADELDKLAEGEEKAGRFQRMREAARKGGAAYVDAVKGGKGKRLRQVAAIGTPVAGLAAAGYGGKKLYDRKKGQTKKSSAFEEVEIDALMKIASEFGYDVAEKVAEEAAEKAGRIRRAARYVDDKAQALGRGIAGIGSARVSGPVQEGGKSLGRIGRGGVKTHRALGYGMPALATAGALYGGKKMMDKRKKGQTKQSSAYDYDHFVDEVAYDMLVDAGFDV